MSDSAADLLSAIDAAVDRGDDDAFVAACDVVVAARPIGAVRTLRRAMRRPLGPGARRAGVVAIVRLGDDALLKEVAQALRSDEALVVVGAARILGAVGDRRAVPNLIEALRTDDPTVGEAVIDALGALGDNVALPWVLAAVEHGFCVEAACRCLGALGDARALPALRRVHDGSDRRLALAAAQALVRLEEQGLG